MAPRRGVEGEVVDVGGVRILGDRAEAEEILQEVFVLVWTRADSYNVTLGSPVGWLLGMSRNRAIDRLRAAATRSTWAPWRSASSAISEAPPMAAAKKAATRKAPAILPRHCCAA